MTCCHYVIFRTYFDILIEFTNNIKCPRVLKAINYEELNATNRGAISQVVTRFSWQRGMFLRRPNRDTISCIVARF